MKRVLKIFAVLLLGMCVTGVALALTVLRPRVQVERTPVVENSNFFCGNELSGLSDKEIDKFVARRQRRSFTQTTCRWRLVPAWRWQIVTREDYNQSDMLHLNPLRRTGWKYGPFSYEERTDYFAWPRLVEKSARATLSRKPWGKVASLAFINSNKLVRDMQVWHVVASGSSGERLEMDFCEDGTPFNSHDGK